MIVCQVCKSINDDFATYCFNCGSALSSASMQTLIKPIKLNNPSLSYMPLRVPSPGMCFYHPNLPAAYICSRCGRQICRSCAKPYLGLVFCPQCFIRARI